MSVDGATAAPVATENGRRAQNGERDPYRFLATRLVRELLAADTQAELMEEDRSRLAQRLLGVLAEGLSHQGAALLDPDDLGVIAARGLQPGELQLLAAPSPASGGPLLRRSLSEQRAFLLGPGSREPLLASLRRIRRQWTALVLIPVYVRRRSVAALVLASTDETASADCLRSLAPVFRLLALLLRPNARVELAAGESLDGGGEIERCRVTIEDLRARLADSEEQRRDMHDRESSLGASQRAEIESLRARVAELEVSGAAEQSARGRCDELEVEGEALARKLVDRDQRVQELERENHGLSERLEELAGRLGAPSPLEPEPSPGANSSTDPGQEGAPELIDPEADVPPIAVLDADDAPLGEIAAAAAAALAEEGDVGMDADLPPALTPFDQAQDPDGSPAVIDLDGADATDCKVCLWHLGEDLAARVWVNELAARARIEVWTGNGSPPRAKRTLLPLNLLEGAVMQAVELIARGHDVDGVVYGLDTEQNLGFEVGPVGWIARPLEPDVALARVRERAGDRLGGLVIVSAQLREVASFRNALANAEIAGSVACDLRQATDLLEIVGTPDAILIDLALEAGQGLALARQLRGAEETSAVPIVFLLPESVEADTFRRDAEAAGILEPYGDDDARRLLNGVLATLR